MGVAQGGVGDQQALLIKDPLGELFRSEFEQEVPRSLRDFGVVLDHHRVRQARGWQDRRWFPTLGNRVAVERDVGEIGKRFRRPVALVLEAEQLGLGVDQLGVRLAASERVVADDVFEERDVRLHPTDAELTQGAVHALARDLKTATHRGDLHQHRVIEWRDH